jgi:hypothetical protein
MKPKPKKDDFRVVPGGLYATRTLSDEEWLDRAMIELAASCKGDEGRKGYASRGIKNIAHSINFPHRIPARRIREAAERHVKHELVRRFGELLAEYADRKCGVTLADQRPDPDPSAPALRRVA